MKRTKITRKQHIALIESKLELLRRELVKLVNTPTANPEHGQCVADWKQYYGGQTAALTNTLNILKGVTNVYAGLS